MAAERGRPKEIAFEKLEATAEDVINIIRTLWERSAELGIDVETRIASMPMSSFRRWADSSPTRLEKSAIGTSWCLFYEIRWTTLG